MNNEQPSYTLGTAQVYYHLDAGLRHPLPQHDAGPEQVVAETDEERRSGRIVVCITRCGSRLLDADNLCGGVKYLLDALRYEGVIPEDNPQAIRLVVRQLKVAKQDRGTKIEIYEENAPQANLR